ncbi:uncharacterized protein LOC142162124 [Nicotiana tabacum]|uniref:Uncharacterized protein LOC142162124 n=1 Tax=Nicotiana tabacum TaxID=4097 RepID=A0AC58RP92_TOBAC
MLTDVKDISPTRDKRVHYPNGDCTIVSHDLSNGKVRGIGREKDGHYLLVPKAYLKDGNNTPPIVKRLSVQKTKDDIFLWHKRLGHASRGSLKELLGYKLEDCKSVIDSCDKNGVAERKYKYLLEVVRAFKFQGHIRMEFWGHCFLDATYVINRLPSQALDGKSPYELFFSRKSSISHLKTLGCLCFASALSRIDKFASKATRKQINPYFPNTTDDDFGFEGAYIDVPIAATEQLYVADENADDIIPETYPNSLRRSHRESKEPIWLKDYVTIRKLVNIVLYPIHNYVSYDNLSLSYQAYLGVFSSVVEPIIFQEDSKDARWVEAMNTESQALKDNKTWERVKMSNSANTHENNGLKDHGENSVAVPGICVPPQNPESRPEPISMGMSYTTPNALISAPTLMGVHAKKINKKLRKIPPRKKER